ncbi:hypothetical protein [Brachybacterium phenoliresistens]|nr:hypothetical protein [Brachybacterium phenoliresistens]
MARREPEIRGAAIRTAGRLGARGPRRPAESAAAAVASVALAAGAVGCAGSGDPAGESGLTWITMPATGMGDSALVEGTIAEQDGCMVLDHGGSRSHLIFEVTDPRPETYAVGDAVRLGGSGSGKASAGLDMPEACDGATSYWYVAPGA